MRIPFIHKKSKADKAKEEKAKTEKDETKMLEELGKAEECAAKGDDKCVVDHLTEANKHNSCPPCARRIGDIIEADGKLTQDQKVTKIHMIKEIAPVTTEIRKKMEAIDAIAPTSSSPKLSHRIICAMKRGLKSLFIK